jgi:hypothetical protein
MNNKARIAEITKELETLKAQEGMDKADAAATEEWKEKALDTIYNLAESNPLVWSDMIWEAGVSKAAVHDTRALGAVFMRAAKKGYITKTDEFIKSEQEGCHGMDVRVWASNIYRTEA